MNDKSAASPKGSTSRAGKRSWCVTPRPHLRAQCCLEVAPARPPGRPDPAIYSQREQLAAGLAPTWDSPDIETYRGAPTELLAETKVRVRNLSARASAVNTMVTLEASAFGIGLPRTEVGSRMVTVPAGGLVEVTFPLPQAILNGEPRYGAHVKLYHPYDANPGNNEGSQMVYGTTTKQVGREFELEFTVVNDASVARELRLAPLANELQARVTPETRVFAPLEQAQARVACKLPTTPAPPPRRDVTVVAWDAAGALIGGLTFFVLDL